MKLNERMRYPHPVLSQFSSDYTTGKFSASFSYQVTDDNQLKIASGLSVGCDELRVLVEDQKASAGYFVVCRRTYFNRLQHVPLGKSEKFFELSQLYEAVSLRPVIWTLEDVENYSSPLIDAEFGKDILIAKGAVIAMGPEFRFSVDPQKFKPFETIFDLARSEDIKPGMIKVDPEGDKITILAEPRTYKSIADMRNIGHGQKILLNAVYMPAVMDIVSRLQIDGRSLEGKRWYRVFKAKCDDMGIDPLDETSSPLDVAQELLKEPLKATIHVMESI